MKEVTLRQLQLAELDILLEIDRVCTENNIKYFLDSGTALGAVRHKGFIPWDDDIDICMMRDDYEKFIRLAPEKLSQKYFLQTLKTDPGYNKLHAKVRKNGTVFKEDANLMRNMNHGLFVDIYPFDYLPKHGKKLFILLNEIFQKMFAYYIEYSFFSWE